MAPADIERARARLRRTVGAAALATLSLTLLLMTGPLLDRRGQARRRAEVFRADRGGDRAGGRGRAARLGARWRSGSARRPGSPALLLLGGVTAAAVVALLAGPAVRLRIAARAHRARCGRRRRSRRRCSRSSPVSSSPQSWSPSTAPAARRRSVGGRPSSFFAAPLGRKPARAADRHPADHVAALWAGTLILNASLAGWRPGTTTSTWQRGRVGALWVAPSVFVAVLAHLRGWPLPAFGIIASAVVCASRRLRPDASCRGSATARWRRGCSGSSSHSCCPPSFSIRRSISIAERAMRSLIATRFAVQAQRQQQTLQDHLFEARARDRRDRGAAAGSGHRTTAGAPAAEPTPESAFFVWKQTALARARLTSAVELYDRTGTLVSRFALNYPEYSAATAGAAGGVRLRVGRVRRGGAIRFGRADACCTPTARFA